MKPGTRLLAAALCAAFCAPTARAIDWPSYFKAIDAKTFAAAEGTLDVLRADLARLRDARDAELRLALAAFDAAGPAGDPSSVIERVRAIVASWKSGSFKVTGLPELDATRKRRQAEREKFAKLLAKPAAALKAATYGALVDALLGESTDAARLPSIPAAVKALAADAAARAPLVAALAADDCDALADLILDPAVRKRNAGSKPYREAAGALEAERGLGTLLDVRAPDLLVGTTEAGGTDAIEPLVAALAALPRESARRVVSRAEYGCVPAYAALFRLGCLGARTRSGGDARAATMYAKLALALIERTDPPSGYLWKPAYAEAAILARAENLLWGERPDPAAALELVLGDPRAERLLYEDSGFDELRAWHADVLVRAADRTVDAIRRAFESRSGVAAALVASGLRPEPGFPAFLSTRTPPDAWRPSIRIEAVWPSGSAPVGDLLPDAVDIAEKALMNADLGGAKTSSVSARILAWRLAGGIAGKSASGLPPAVTAVSLLDNHRVLEQAIAIAGIPEGLLLDAPYAALLDECRELLEDRNANGFPAAMTDFAKRCAVDPFDRQRDLFDAIRYAALGEGALRP